MKKLIAISVMCALAVGVAFADTSVGGAIFVGGKFVQGTNVEDSHPQTGTLGTDGYNTVLKVNFGDSAAGGKFSLHNIVEGGGNKLYDYVGWWQPIPQLRLQIGADTDGNFGTAQINGWGFTGEQKNAGGFGALGEYGSGTISNQGRDVSRTAGWYDGTGATSNFQARIYPIEGLSINLWIPFDNTENVAFTFARFELNVQYRIADVGNVNVSFQCRTGYLEADEDTWHPDGQLNPSNSPKLFASFFLTAIENMAVDLGLAYRLPFTNEATDTTTFHPFEIGLGFRMNFGDFQFKLRSGISFAGSTEVTGADPVKDPFEVSVNINPNYKIGNVTIFFYAGLGIQAVDDWETQSGGIFANSGSNAVVAWFVNPYIMISAGSLRFLTGFQIGSDGVKFPYYENGTLNYDNAKITWAIPFGFYTYF